MGGLGLKVQGLGLTVQGVVFFGFRVLGSVVRPSFLMLKDEHLHTESTNSEGVRYLGSCRISRVKCSAGLNKNWHKDPPPLSLTLWHPNCPK